MISKKMYILLNVIVGCKKIHNFINTLSLNKHTCKPIQVASLKNECIFVSNVSFQLFC